MTRKDKDEDEDIEGAPVLSGAEKLTDVLERLTRIQERQPVPQETSTQARFVTPWNPTGKRNRPKLKRRVFENGHPLSETRLTDEEITLLNGLKHGRYHHRRWTVMERDEEGATAMHLYWPNKTEADRIDMARLAPNGLADVLRMIHDEMKTVKQVEA